MTFMLWLIALLALYVLLRATFRSRTHLVIMATGAFVVVAIVGYTIVGRFGLYAPVQALGFMRFLRWGRRFLNSR